MGANKPKLLVVDDDQAVVSFLAARLGRHFDVTGTTNPRNAVEMARAEKPDVILCDINMPGMQGDDVAFALSQDPRTATVPLIYLTALVGPEDDPDLEGVFGDYPTISKSATTEELRDIVASALGLPEGE